jgi:surface antigen
VTTSSLPSVGAIVVYRPGGLYSELGHVAIVVATTETSYTVSEMNAPRWGVVSVRIITWPDAAVLGFIPEDAAGVHSSLLLVHTRKAQAGLLRHAS